MATKNRKKELQKILKDANIYNPKLDSQISLIVRLENLLNGLYDKSKDEEPLSLEINASGTEKKVINPIYPLIMKLESQLQDAYTAIGLNYNSKPQNMDKKDGVNGLESFIEAVSK